MNNSLDDILPIFQSEGFDIVGCAPAVPDETKEREFAEWIEAGFHGEMQYLEKHVHAKYRPDELLPGARTVIVVAVNYYQETEGPMESAVEAGAVAMYAWGRDYHKVIGNRLKRIARRLERDFSGASCRPFTDALPLSERHYASRSGIGFIGKHTLLITPQYGSWVLLGGMLTTLDIDRVGTANEIGEMRCPSGCTRCIDACPTGALLAPYRIDASRCISYRTIERKPAPAVNCESSNDLPLEKAPEEAPMVRPEDSTELDASTGTRVFGCDACQVVCPFNLRAKNTAEPDFTRWIAGPNISLSRIESMTGRDEFVEAFAGSPVMRAGLEGMKRNAAVVRRNGKPKT